MALGASAAPQARAKPAALTPTSPARQHRARRPVAPRAQAPINTQTVTHSTAVDQLASSRSAGASTSGRPAPAEPEPLLAYEIVQGALVRYSTAVGGRAPPTAVLVHGILGKRQNMLSFARRLVEGFPHWQVVVADLRCHGESAPLAGAMRGPHGVESAAGDVIKLLSALKLFPEMLIGHSFGGKVVLQMTKAWSGAAVRVPRPVQVWVLDALPGEVRSGDMGGTDRPSDLISTLQHVPLPVPSRSWLIGHLEGSGFSRQVATWAATNLAPLAGGGLGWGFDLAGIAQMFRSYESADLWPLLASPADGVTLSFVKAERSTFRWGGSDEARIRQLGHAVHELPDAGHWVHSDNPAGLFQILAPSFQAPPDLRVQSSPPASPRNNIVSPPPSVQQYQQYQQPNQHSAAGAAAARQLHALEM